MHAETVGKLVDNTPNFQVCPVPGRMNDVVGTEWRLNYAPAMPKEIAYQSACRKLHKQLSAQSVARPRQTAKVKCDQLPYKNLAPHSWPGDDNTAHRRRPLVAKYSTSLDSLISPDTCA